MNAKLRVKAQNILRANDRGGYTVPTARLYPFQWNWDSGFTALGIATYDKARAWEEMRRLFAGQWDSGMVPHIIFWQDDPGYFPGASTWDTGTTPPTSGCTQPPVAASIIWQMARDGDQEDRRCAAELLPNLMNYHRWLITCRDPAATGLVAIIHPWESGRDNCPDWQASLAQVPVPADMQELNRRDTEHVDSSQRPTDLDYRRFMAIVRHGRLAGWDHVKIYRDGPFLMGDPGMQFIFLRACRDLGKLAKMLDKLELRGQIDEWIARLEEGCELLWNAQAGGYCAKDLRGGEFSPALTNASMLAFYAGASNSERRDLLAAHAKRILAKCRYGFPSWDPEHEAFDRKRYWCGPSWSVMNYMIQIGMAEQGLDDLARKIRAATLELNEHAGFFEYYDPLTGDGLGGKDFSWTAAIYLQLVGAAADTE